MTSAWLLTPSGGTSAMACSGGLEGGFEPEFLTCLRPCTNQEDVRRVLQQL